MIRGLIFFLSASLSLQSLLDPAAQAQNYFPLSPGSHWYYETYFDGTMEVFYEGDRTIAGRPTIILQEQALGEEQTRFNVFWSRDGQDNLFKHGSENLLVFPGPPTWAHYDPPLLYVAPPLYLGKSWEISSIMTHNWEDHVYPYYIVEGTAEVFRERDMHVPAGTYHVFGIRYDIALLPPNGRRGIASGKGDARRLEETRQVVEERWYCEDVGVVRRYLTDGFPIYSLVSWHGSTPAESCTWGHVKALFR